MKPTHNYMTLATPGSKKTAVCSKRIGSRDRMVVIATCTEETVAERIVDALNCLQGKVDQLEVPAQRILTEVREQLTREKGRVSQANSDKHDMQHRLRLLQDTYDTKCRELQRVERERDAAQKAARESA